MTTKRLPAMLCAVLAAALVAAPAAAAMQLKAGHLQPATSDQGIAIDFFAERVKALTNGEIEVQVFHSAELGKSIPVQLENLVSGAQDFFIDTMDYFKVWDDRFGAINTPFVFRDRHDHFRKFLASDLFNDIVATVEERGVVFLGKRKYNWLRAGDRGSSRARRSSGPRTCRATRCACSRPRCRSSPGGRRREHSGDPLGRRVHRPRDRSGGRAHHRRGGVLRQQAHRGAEVLHQREGVLSDHRAHDLQADLDKLDDGQRQAIEQASFEAGELYTETSRRQTVEKTRKAQAELGLTIILPPLGPWHDHMAKVHAEFEEQGLLPSGLITKVKAIE